MLVGSKLEPATGVQGGHREGHNLMKPPAMSALWGAR